jgi:hypothetical protein
MAQVGYSPVSIPGQVMWDLWCTKWQRGRFSPNTSVFPGNSHSSDSLTLSTIYHPGLVQ